MPDNPYDFPGINVKWGQAAGGGLTGSYPNPTVSSISGLTAGGYLSGTYPNPTVVKIKGTITNDNATAGDVGEYVTSTLTSGSAVSLTTGTVTNVVNISLTVGDWDVTGIPHFMGGPTTTVDYIMGSLTITSATGDAGNDRLSYLPMFSNTAFSVVNPVLIVGSSRFSLSSTTTVYLVVQCGFAVSTASAYGIIRARRIR